jgi:RHS repeat-associated protein
VTDDGGVEYLYDGDGRICAVANYRIPFMTIMTGYLYDAEGRRVSKGTISAWSCDPVLNGFQPTDDHILDLAGEQVTEMGVGGTSDGSTTSGLVWHHTNVWAAGKLLATYDGDSATTSGLHFYFNDPLGTRRVQTDFAGNVEQKCSSLPFGDGETCGPTPTENLFTGKERDSESGNDYFGARYYASTMGRFMSPDWSAKLMPVPYAKLDNPQTLNLYAYVGNNPLSRIDADGHYEISCGSGSKNCNQKELDRINKQIAKDQVSKNKARAAAAGAYGGLGEKNGVIISVVDQPDSKNANVNGTTGAQAGTPGFAYTPDGKATGVATAVTLKAGLDGGDLKDAIDHEGQHALDRQNYVNGLMQDATGESSKGLNITGRMSEVNAYTTQGLSPGEIKQQLSKPPYSTDPNIDKPLFPMPSAY